MIDDPQILIVGAGPVGLSLAIGLARRGVSSVVFEKKPELSSHSKAIVVQPRTLQIFEEWGLLSMFRERSEWVTHLTPRSTSGKVLLDIDFSVLDEFSSVSAAAILPQDETEKILYEQCEASELVDVRLGHEVVAFNEVSGGVRVRVRCGEESYPLEARYLCACDGAHSTVREDLGLKLEGKTYDAHAILADFRLVDDRDEKPWPIMNIKGSGLRFVVRFADHRWRLILALPGKGSEADLTDNVIQDQISGLLGAGPAEIEWKSFFRIHLRNSPHFRVGRTLLLGDAAHLNSPAGGQGMNAGIQDAHNLAWKLARVLAGTDEEQFLSSYDLERQDAIRHGVDVVTDRFTRFGIATNPTLRRVPLFFLKLAMKVPAVRRKITSGMAMVQLHYDPSPLIDESGGKLLPDLKLRGGGRLRAAIGPDGGVLSVGSEYVACGSQRFDLDGRGKLRGRFLTVRPDHVIAYAGKSRQDAERAAEALGIKTL